MATVARHGPPLSTLQGAVASPSSQPASPLTGHLCRTCNSTRTGTYRTNRALGENLMPWYLRSLGDRDTHYGDLQPDGHVIAVCGAVFKPRPLPYDRLALAASPPDPDQICPQCQRDKLTS